MTDLVNFQIYGWQIWIIAGILLLIVEIFLPTFLASCLAIGSFAAGVASFLDGKIQVQLLAFSAGTLIAFFTVRPFMLRYAHRRSGKIKTNIDAMTGKTGRVTVTIDNQKSEGRVSIEGEDWKAESDDNTILVTGEKVIVLRVDSTKLIVKSLN